MYYPWKYPLPTGKNDVGLSLCHSTRTNDVIYTNNDISNQQ